MAVGDDAMAYLLRQDNNVLLELDATLVIRQVCVAGSHHNLHEPIALYVFRAYRWIKCYLARA